MSLNSQYILRKLTFPGLLMALGMVLFFANPAVSAQVAPPTATTGALPSAIRLTDQQDVYDLGPGTYVTRDENARLSYTELVNGHLGARRGLNTDYNILPLGTTPVPHWIIMAVKNDTVGTSRFILSLGTHAQGRYGSYSRLFIYNHLGGNYLIYAMPDKNGNMPKEDSLPIHSGGIPFDLAPGRQALLVVYVVPDGGSPVTIAPQIMTEQAFWEAQTSPYSTTAMLRIFIICVIGFFIGIIAIRRDWTAIPFILYMASQMVLFNVQNNNPYSTFPFASELTPLLGSLCAICGLILTRSFLGITGAKNKESTIIFGFIAGMVLMCGVAVFIVPETSFLRATILLAVPLLACALMTLLSMAQAIIGKSAAGLIAVGWLILLLGAIVSILSSIGVLPPSASTINLYWLSLVVQSTLLIVASIIRMRDEDISNDEEEEILHADDTDTVSRIRQAKDGSENARLLKVIEHERSVLQELRDRELQQNEDMRRARDDADLANRAKSAFLAVISHEIRTPMSGIMGMVRLLLDTTLSRDQRDYAKTIQDSGDAMLALLNDILDFEKIESGKMDLEIVDFDLMRLVNDIMTLMSGHANQKKIILKADIDASVPRYVRGDPVRLRQVLLNLTGNAIKFTSEGSVVLIVKTVNDGNPSRAGWNQIYFGIRDSGIGISKEAQKNLFNPFSQADNSISRKYGGSGLGLAICQRLIEAMGDKIAIDSAEGQGSTFYFTVTMETGAADRVEDLSNASRQSVKSDTAMHILCVDDNDINLKLLKEFVSRLGHQATLAGTGEQALNLMKVEKFDVVLMDVELPGISGMGATRAIRAIPDRERAATPVIALTGNVRDEDIRACYAANMNGHLAKPIEPDKLKAQIDKVILGKLDNPVVLEDEATQSPSVTEIRISDKQSATPASSLSFEDEDEATGTSGMSAVRSYALSSDAAPKTGLAQSSATTATPGPVHPVHATVFTDMELDEDSFAAALEMSSDDAPADVATRVPFATTAGAGVETVKTPINPYVFDHGMLDGLKVAMKQEELKEMIDGLTSKNDEILVALQSAIPALDFPVIAARAHEMRGMAGNFGLKELSDLAGRIEKAAKDNVPDGLSDILAMLPNANSRSKAALDQWMSS